MPDAAQVRFESRGAIYFNGDFYYDSYRDICLMMQKCILLYIYTLTFKKSKKLSDLKCKLLLTTLNAAIITNA